LYKNKENKKKVIRNQKFLRIKKVLEELLDSEIIIKICSKEEENKYINYEKYKLKK